MKSILSAAAAVVTIVATLAGATSLADQPKADQPRGEQNGAEQPKTAIIGLAPDQIRWFTPPYYTDGRQRAQLFGNSSEGGAWIDRVKIPGGARALAHRHPQDELVTVIEGTWYLGEGAKFDSAKLKGYPAGSFIVIPAGLPHFVAAEKGAVVVQLSGTGKFQTDYLEKQSVTQRQTSEETPMAEQTPLHFVFYFAAPPEKVWQGFVSAESNRILFAGADFEADLRPGGPINWVGTGPDGKRMVYVGGKVLQCDPPKLLQYTFSLGGSGKASRVTIELVPESEATRVAVTHDQWAQDDPGYARSADGWPRILSRLKTLIETGKTFKPH